MIIACGLKQETCPPSEGCWDGWGGQEDTWTGRTDRSGKEPQVSKQSSSTLVPDGLVGGFDGGGVAGSRWEVGMGQRGQKAGLNGHHRSGRSRRLQWQSQECVLAKVSSVGVCV